MKELYQRVMWAMRRPCMRQKRERNVPKTRNETRPSGGSGPLTVSRRSLPSRFLAAHTADELECNAQGSAPLGLRGGCVIQAMRSATVAGARQAAQAGLEWSYHKCHRVQASGRHSLRPLSVTTNPAAGGP